MNQSLNKIARSLVPPNEELPEINVSGIQLNSSQVTDGDLFIAVPGTKVDGHDFIHDAIAAGAKAVISNGRDIGKLSVPQIKVANPRRATSIVAAEFYGHPSKDLTVIGITGTNGKTTTSSLLTAILQAAGKNSAQLGTLGLIAEGFPKDNTLTTPDAITLQKLFSELRDADFSHIIMEVSSHALDQYRVADVDFDIAVFTNLTPEHLDYHKTQESYFQAKARLFRMLPLESTAIVNESDPNGIRIGKESKSPMITFSRGNGNSLHFNELELTISGIKGLIQAGQLDYEINSKLAGEFNAENILAAVSVAHALGIGKQFIEAGINQCSSVPGRMEFFPLKSGATVIIDYAHTPDAYEKVLGTLKHMVQPETQIHVVFGAGGDRDKSKRSEMGRIAELFADHCYVTPDNPRTEDPNQITKEIISGFTENAYTTYTNRANGLRDALTHAKRADLVVVLGKGREEYQEISGDKVFYSDLKIMREFQ